MNQPKPRTSDPVANMLTTGRPGSTQIHPNIILPSTSLLPWRSLTLRSFTKILYAFLNCSMCATCPAHLSRLDLRFLIVLCEEYNACCSALYNFPIIWSLLVPNIFLRTVFSNTLNLCSSQDERPSFTRYITIVDIILLLYVLTFNFLESRWDDKILLKWKRAFPMFIMRLISSRMSFTFC